MAYCITCDAGQVCLTCDDRGATPFKCNVAQNYCGAQSEYAIDNGWLPPGSLHYVSRDDIIIKEFPKAYLSQIVSAITQLEGWTLGPGGQQGPGASPSGGTPASPITSDFLKASDLQSIANALASLNSQNAYVPPAVDAVVTASIINNLIAIIQNPRLNSRGCPQCVSSCNIQCDTCNTCDYCQACNDCQNPCEYACQYCNWCENPCEYWCEWE